MTATQKSLRVALVSAAGSGNYGDELIRMLWLKYYEKCSIVDISFSRFEMRGIQNCQFIDLHEFWDTDVDLKNVDLIHFLGGRHINDEFKTISKWTESLSRIDKKIPLIASGLGIHPSNPEEISNLFSHNWKLVGLRDYESFLQTKKILGNLASWSFDDT
jgi:hypothetical protein